MFSQIPKKIAGQLAQYSPVAGLTMIVGHGTDPKQAAAHALGQGVEGAEPHAGDVAHLASLTDHGICSEPLTSARVAAPAAPAAPPQVIHEIMKQVPVPVPSPGGPSRVVVQPVRHDEHHTQVTNIDNHPTTVNTTVNQLINAGGDVNTSVNTNTVSGKGALGITEAETHAPDGSPAHPAVGPSPEIDDDFGAGAKPTDVDSGTGTDTGSGNSGDGSGSDRPDGPDGGNPTPDGPHDLSPPAHGPDDAVQPDPHLEEGPPLDDDPDGPTDEPQDHLAQTVHGTGGEDPLGHDLVGATAGDPLPHELPAEGPNDDLLGHTIDTPDHHVDPSGLEEHHVADAPHGDDLSI
jgi:hypothetical protein